MAMFMPKGESSRHVKLLLACTTEEREFLAKEAADRGVDTATVIRDAIREKYCKMVPGAKAP